jgi:hypothetical protein
LPSTPTSNPGIFHADSNETALKYKERAGEGYKPSPVAQKTNPITSGQVKAASSEMIENPRKVERKSYKKGEFN